MAISEINVPASVHKSKWGLFGKVLGGLAGAIAGVATGGAASGPLAATLSGLGGAATGMGTGGMVGEAIDPTKVEPGMSVPQTASEAPKADIGPKQETGMSRYALADPDIQTKLIKDSINDVLSHPRLSTEAKDEYVQFGQTAIDRIRRPISQKLTLGGK